MKGQNKNGRMNVEGIVGILAKNGMAEFEHEEKGKKLSIKIKCSAKPKEVHEEIKSEKETKPKIEATKEKIQESYILKSQYVGYFHILREKEDESVKPFVKISDKVGLEDTLGILECMKGQIQHEIKLKDYQDFQADYGIIEKILAENGMPVDYGKPLFEIGAVKE